MKVMCIREATTFDPGAPLVHTGNTYETIREIMLWGSRYFKLAGFPENFSYSEVLFAPTSDMDESELYNQRVKKLETEFENKMASNH